MPDKNEKIVAEAKAALGNLERVSCDNVELRRDVPIDKWKEAVNNAVDAAKNVIKGNDADKDGTVLLKYTEYPSGSKTTDEWKTAKDGHIYQIYSDKGNETETRLSVELLEAKRKMIIKELEKGDKNQDGQLSAYEACPKFGEGDNTVYKMHLAGLHKIELVLKASGGVLDDVHDLRDVRIEDNSTPVAPSVGEKPKDNGIKK